MVGSFGVLAQAIAPGQSMLAWVLQSLSWSTLLALLAGVAIFAGACTLIATKRRPAVIAAYMALLPLPVLISVCGTLKGMIASFAVIAASPNLQPTTADYAGAWASSLFSLLAAIMVSSPTYLVLASGLLFGTLRANADATQRTAMTV
ncbi:MAG: hypothetical protein SH850_29840 [Planctomycetaceae bacterium]|nr:hypothetical protein [Planctomycetaceae bacterium]